MLRQLTNNLVSRSVFARGTLAPSASASSSINIARRQIHASFVKFADEHESTNLDVAAEKQQRQSYPDRSDRSSSSRFPSLGARGGQQQQQRQDNPFRLFVGGLDANTDNAQLQEAFSKIGDVQSAFIIKDRETQRSRRFGFVDFANAESVQKALGDSSAIQDVLGDGARVEAISNSPAPRRDSSPREGGRFGSGGFGGDRSERGESRFGNSRRGERTSAVVEPSESTSLYFGNLPFDLDAAALEEALTEHAPEGVTISAIRMPGVQRSQYGEEESSSFSDTRKNKGFAFVEMSNVEDAKKLMEALKQAVQEGYQWPMEQREDSFPLIKYAASTGPKTRDDFSNNRERRSNNSYGQRDNFSRGDRQQRRY